MVIDLEDDPPVIPKNMSVPMEVYVQKENSMNNRFGSDVVNHVKTDTIILIDDDVLLSEGMIFKMLKSYQTNENQIASSKTSQTDTNSTIVGIRNDARIASNKEGYIFPCWRIEGYIFSLACWKSPFSSLPKPNVVIGKTMLIHKKWLKLYQQDLALWSYTGEQKHFCEDILMNALIRNSTSIIRPPILVEKDTINTRQVLEESGGLSSKGLSSFMWGFEWAKRRTECVRWGVNHFGKDIWAG